MKVLILVGSDKSELYPFTETLPKPLLPIAGLTILENLLDRLNKLRLTEVVMVVGDKKEQIISKIGNGSKYGLRINYIEQSEQSGIGHAVSLSEKFFSEDRRFLLLFGDIVIGSGLLEKLLYVGSNDSQGCYAAISHAKNNGNFSYVYLNKDMKISKITAQSSEKKISNYVLSGAFLFSASIFNLLKKYNFDINLVYENLSINNQFYTCVWDNNWIDVYFPWDLLTANRNILSELTKSEISSSASIDENVKIMGSVIIEENAKISSGAIISGPCHIGKNTYIGNNCLIRDHVMLGEGTKIGYGSEIKNSIIGKNCQIGRLSFIGDSVIGHDVVIGTSTTTLNYDSNGDDIFFQSPNVKLNTKMHKLGCFIGDKSVIGSCHSILHGLAIPPGKIIKDKITVDQDF